ncbi:MAG: ECF transporter S component [Clostridia bacterium]
MKNKATDKKRWNNFSIYDLILIAMLAALSIAFKAIVGTLIRMITGPLGVPGGALAGGFYMLWLTLAIALTNKRGSALFIAIIQIIVLLTTGLPGSHGVWTIITYFLPAVAVELVFLHKPKEGYNILQFIIGTILANIVGTIGSNLLFYRLSAWAFLFVLLAASLSGALGGVLGYLIVKQIEKTGLIKGKKLKKNNEDSLDKLIEDINTEKEQTNDEKND